jgi:predicted phage tail protein
MLVTVKLLGELGRRFGREYRLVANSAAQVFRALSLQLPGFTEYLYQSSDRGIGFRVVNDDPMGMSEKELELPLGDRLIVAPVIQGRGPLGRILAGVALIGVGLALGPTAGWLGFKWGTAFLTLGASLTIGGIAQALTPTPSGPKNSRESKRSESYLFDRSTEISDQGLPVPLLYGERYVSSLAVISSGLSAEEIPVGSN